MAACGSGGGETGGGGGGGGSRGGGSGRNLNVTPRIVVQNESNVARTETLRAAVGFTETMIKSLANVGVRDIGTAWIPLEHWPDGSIKLALAQFTDTIGANETKSYDVVRDVTAASGPFDPHPWVAGRGTALRVGARVRDTFNVVYEAELTSGTPETLQETYLVRTQRYRLYHRVVGSGGIGRDFLTSTMYVTQYHDMPYVTVDWVLGNDYWGADDLAGKTDPNWFPLGMIDLNRADFLVRGVDDARCYLGDLHGVAARESDQGWSVFKAMEQTFLDDGQTRRYRFQLRIENAGASQGEKEAWRNAFPAFCDQPLFPLADLKSWQDTGALGLYGGPITGPTDGTKRAEYEHSSWLATSQFGTWGDFGDTKNTATTGTPRNTPICGELAHAIMGGYPKLLQKLEQKAWVQACRPYHLYGMEVGSDEDLMLWDMPPIYPGSRDLSRQSFGRRALWANDPYLAYRTRVPWAYGRAHDFGHYDEEHMSVNLLYDYWAMTGDAWAKEELRLMGHCLKGLMRLKSGYTAQVQTARAEGWCMQSMVQCYLASGDESIKTHAIRRIHEVLWPGAERNHPSRALSMSGPDGRTGFPSGVNYRCYTPWGGGAELYGFLAAHRFMGQDTLALTLAEDVVTQVEYGWVTNYTHPYWGFVKDGLRYVVPTYVDNKLIAASYFDSAVPINYGDSPLGGVHGFLIGGLFQLAMVTENDVLANKAIYYAKKLVPVLDDGGRWYTWNFVIVEELMK